MQSQKDLIDKLVDQNYGTDTPRRDIDTHLENLKFKTEAVYQVSIDTIEKSTGLKFPIENIYQPAIPDKNELKENVDETAGRHRSFREDNSAIVSIAGMILD